VRGTNGAAWSGLEARPAPGTAGAAPVVGSSVGLAEAVDALPRASWHPLTTTMLASKMANTPEMLFATSLPPLVSSGARSSRRTWRLDHQPHASVPTARRRPCDMQTPRTTHGIWPSSAGPHGRRLHLLRGRGTRVQHRNFLISASRPSAPMPFHLATLRLEREVEV
jgi:hypothetical protein